MHIPSMCFMNIHTYIHTYIYNSAEGWQRLKMGACVLCICFMHVLYAYTHIHTYIHTCIYNSAEGWQCVTMGPKKRRQEKNFSCD